MLDFLYTHSILELISAWTFGYDKLDRLATAVPSSGGHYSGHSGCWNYDSFGNRLQESYTGTCPTGSNLTYTANNQVGGTSPPLTYDTAGNVNSYDSSSGNTYAYDGEGRLCAMGVTISGITNITQYYYDAEGQRAGKAALTWIGSGSPNLSNSATGVCGAPESNSYWTKSISVHFTCSTSAATRSPS